MLFICVRTNFELRAESNSLSVLKIRPLEDPLAKSSYGSACDDRQIDVVAKLAESSRTNLYFFAPILETKIKT